MLLIDFHSLLWRNWIFWFLLLPNNKNRIVVGCRTLRWCSDWLDWSLNDEWPQFTNVAVTCFTNASRVLEQCLTSSHREWTAMDFSVWGIPPHCRSPSSLCLSLDLYVVGNLSHLQFDAAAWYTYGKSNTVWVFFLLLYGPKQTVYDERVLV